MAADASHLLGVPVSNRKSAPALGANTEEILTEMLGYSWDDAVALKNEGVIL